MPDGLWWLPSLVVFGAAAVALGAGVMGFRRLGARREQAELGDGRALEVRAKGLIVEAPTFPGWETFGAMAQHFRFVRDHHRRIKKVGIVTDSVIGEVAEKLAAHFIAAEIRHFPAGQLEAARQWVSGTTTSPPPAP